MVFVYWYYDNLSVGEVVLVISLISSMLHATENMSYFSRHIIQLCGGIRDGLDLLYRPVEICDSPSARQLSIKTAHIRYQNVSFGYRGNESLFNNLS